MKNSLIESTIAAKYHEEGLFCEKEILRHKVAYFVVE